MAIANDSQNFNTGGTTLGITISGANRMLLIGILSTAGDDVTSVTLGAQTCTQLSKQAIAGKGTQYLYYLVAPNTGAGTITANGTGSTTYMGATSYTGVNQVAPEANAKSTNTSTSITTSVTTVTDNAWVSGWYYNNSAGGGSAGSGTVEVSGNSFLGMLDSGGPVTPAGSRSLIFQGYSSAAAGLIVAAIAPAPANGNLLMFM